MKRISVFSDGTWNSPKSKTKSNIYKLYQATLHKSAGVVQKSMYDAGIGTEGGWYDYIMGAALGYGIDLNIQQLYAYIGTHYNDGDEIYMFGFSRGAYTVRSLAGMINNCGLARSGNMETVKRAYKLYRSNKTADDPELVQFRKENGDRVKITLVACFDTVGALGVPARYPFSSFMNRSYEFHDTNLSNIIENAIHMLSIDEDQLDFKPTRMTPNCQVPNQLTQQFFWGTHAGVGGCARLEVESGQLTLRFLIKEMKMRNLGLAFNTNLIPSRPNVLVEPKKFRIEGIMSLLSVFARKQHRKIDDVSHVNESAIERYVGVEEWRPESLLHLSKEIFRIRSL